MNKEEWKDIPGYEGYYQINNNGDVKSLKKKRANRHGFFLQKEKILRSVKNGDGYLGVCLIKNKKGINSNIHVLLAICFMDHVPCGQKRVVDHINNIKTDNRLSNLQIISHRENLCKDKKRGSSKYIGVSWAKRANKWVSVIGINGKTKYLGCFVNEIDAHNAYQNELKKL